MLTSRGLGLGMATTRTVRIRRVGEWVSSRFLGIVATLVVLVVPLLVGCGPSEPFAPVAVALDGSSVEFYYTDCRPSKISQVRVIVIKSNQKFIKGNEHVVWKLSFDTPATVNRIVLENGAPAGAVVDIPLVAPLDNMARYEVFVGLDGGMEPHEGFEVESLQGGQVMYQDKYMSRKKFLALSSCM